MGIYLRTITDETGDTVEYAWYCSFWCYQTSLNNDPPSDTFEEGGAYPCGAEHDYPDLCDTCGKPVGNPLTPEGEAYVREVVEPNPLSFPATQRIRAAYRQEYSYLFDN